MITPEALEADAATRHLAVLGYVDLTDDSEPPAGAKRLVLLGPAPQSFWAQFQASPEARDGTPDPMDRWSIRVIGAWADKIGGQALYPFGGPPYLPFLRWAVASGTAWPSPVGPLVHDRFGLMVSYRGALALPHAFPMPATPSQSPCAACEDKPCLTACPVEALSEAAYDVPSCKTHIATQAGRSCLNGGCLVRRACPKSLGAGRDPAQSAYHMSLFLGPS